jgi:uncharacterized protein
VLRFAAVNDTFQPVRWLRGPHLETIVPAKWPAPAIRGAEERVIAVDSGSAVKVEISRPSGRARGMLLLLHGMGGSAASGYLRRAALSAISRGWIAVRMNLRNCGATEALSRTLYNAGQSDDADRVLETLEAEGVPRPYAAAGFSLGGNLIRRYAGTSGTACRVDAVAGVNPPVDLEACCRAIELPGNWLYQTHFVRLLCDQIRRVRRLRPVPGPPAIPWRIRTVRRFDALFTAPDAGHRSAEAYYAEASAGPRLEGVRRPALVLSAANDPFVPVGMFAPHRGTQPRFLRFVHPARGGHVGYWQGGARPFWAGEAVLDFFDDALGR